MDNRRVVELLYQALEMERSDIQIYETALKCALDDELAAEWQTYLEETRNHAQILLNVMADFGLDSEAETSGRQVVRPAGGALVRAMEMALATGTREAAQLVACECVVEAGTKDDLNYWELIYEVGRKYRGEEGKASKAA